MLVDPRPYTYQYRAPRYNNPTYLSNNLYDSLYMRSSSNQRVQNDYFPAPSNDAPLAKQRNHSMDLAAMKKEANPQTNKQSNPGFKLPQIASNPEPSHQLPQVPSAHNRHGIRRGFQRFKVYENQQKPYDIIKNIPKAYESNRLRNWPKFSLEHSLRQKGLFHNYDKEDL